MQSMVRQVRTIVIDDSPAFLCSLCSFLQDHQRVQVVGTAENAEEAFALVEQIRPELVLIDFQMPGMNGLEAASQLRRQSPETKVILVTMHDSPQLRQASLESGAHGFVSKGQLSQDLPVVLAEVLATSETLE